MTIKILSVQNRPEPSRQKRWNQFCLFLLSGVLALFFFGGFSPIAAEDDLDQILAEEFGTEASEVQDPRTEFPFKAAEPKSNPPGAENLSEPNQESKPKPNSEKKENSSKKEAGGSLFYRLLQDPSVFMPAGKELLTKGNLSLLLGLLTVIPAVLITTTCYVRVVTVLALLRHALGIPQIPSTQILAAVSLFLTILVMSPTWTRVWREAWVPYVQQEITAEEAFHRGEAPIRTFLWKQIERTRNTENVRLFMNTIPDAAEPKYYEDIPWRALLPAYMLSELKTAFMIGFQLFLPFIIIDLVVSGVMVSMGMMMLPPTVVSLPFKLMLFVLLDAWDPIVRMLIESFTLT